MKPIRPVRLDSRDRCRVYDRQRRAIDPKLRQAKEIRDSAEWKRFRVAFLREHPLCFDPWREHQLSGRVEVARAVHHIVGLGVDASKAFEAENCAALCIACHNRIEALERRGKPTQFLFTKAEE